MTLENKYGVNSKFFYYINDSSQIPRFIEGTRNDQNLFIFDVPYHHKNGTTPVSIVIDDNTNITIFTNKETKYIIPHIDKLLTEKGGNNYGVPCVCLDVAGVIANYYLDKIREIDDDRVKNKGLLRDKSKHHNAEYIDHLNELRTIVSGYATSLASDHSLLYSIKEIMGGKLNTTQKKVLDRDLIEYRQAKLEAKSCFGRTRAVLRGFSMQVGMGNSRKLGVLTCVSFPISIFSMVTSFFGMNLGSQGIALPFSENWITASSVGLILTAIAALFVYFFIFYKK